MTNWRHILSWQIHQPDLQDPSTWIGWKVHYLFTSDPEEELRWAYEGVIAAVEDDSSSISISPLYGKWKLIDRNKTTTTVEDRPTYHESWLMVDEHDIDWRIQFIDYVGLPKETSLKLGWRIYPESFEVGTRVRLLVPHTSPQYTNITIPAGTTGEIRLKSRDTVWVDVDWLYPTPHDYISTEGNDRGWCFSLNKNELELI